MFTGIVEGLGTVTAIEQRGDGYRMTVALGPLAAGVEVGDSIANSGCCLTVVAVAGDAVSYDLIPETMERTRFGALEVGSKVDVERPLKAGGRLDGHIVQGHVDGVARCVGRTYEGGDKEGEEGQVRFDFEGPEALTHEMVMKGSIAINGVSLTLTAVGEGTFSVAIIPHTLALTSFGDMQPGDPVNVETDVVGKHILKAVRPYLEMIEERLKAL